MDQKNTIVKCHAKPDCLFNHNGICDNYVITIGEDGKCDCYVETARFDNFKISEIKEIALYEPGSKEPLLKFKEPQRGQRAKCNFFEDANIVDIHDLHLGEPVLKENKNKTIIKIPPMSKEDRAIMNDIGYVPPKESDQMCWYCDHGRSGNCSLTAKPMRDSNGKCGRFTSTGGNR